MAVGAPNIALGDLCLDSLQTKASLHHDADAQILLSATVIELEDYRVGLTTVDAWMIAEIFGDEPADLRLVSIPCCLRSCEIITLVSNVVRSRITTEAFFTLRVDISRTTAHLTVELR